MMDFSAIPQKWLMVGGAVVAAVLGWRIFGGSNAAVSTQDGTLGYDPALVQLGTEAALERERMANSLELAKIDAGTSLALAGMDAATTEKLANIGRDIATGEQTAAITMTGLELASTERMFGADLAVQNGIAAATFDLERRKEDNAAALANQRIGLEHLALDFQHDVAKKGIEVQKWGIAADIVGNIAPMVLK